MKLYTAMTSHGEIRVHKWEGRAESHAQVVSNTMSTVDSPEQAEAVFNKLVHAAMEHSDEEETMVSLTLKIRRPEVQS